MVVFNSKIEYIILKKKKIENKMNEKEKIIVFQMIRFSHNINVFQVVRELQLVGFRLRLSCFGNIRLPLPKHFSLFFLVEKVLLTSKVSNYLFTFIFNIFLQLIHLYIKIKIKLFVSIETE